MYVYLCMCVCKCVLVRVWVGVDAHYLYYQEYHFDSHANASNKVTILCADTLTLHNIIKLINLCWLYSVMITGVHCHTMNNIVN